ncbi:MAG: hypothetical protein ACR2KQ_11660 [Actinomycetota bacterium]
MENITWIEDASTGEICVECECEMTVCSGPEGGSELSCDCRSYLVA